MVMSAASLEKDDRIDIVFADGEVGALITNPAVESQD